MLMSYSYSVLVALFLSDVKNYISDVGAGSQGRGEGQGVTAKGRESRQRDVQ
jgi:hypothetical protein